MNGIGCCHEGRRPRSTSRRRAQMQGSCDEQGLLAHNRPRVNHFHLERVLPVVVSLVEHDPSRTVFTRFVTPRTAEERPGRWQHYFTGRRQPTRPLLTPGALDLVPPLDRFAPPATIIDKPAYSAFFQGR